MTGTFPHNDLLPGLPPRAYGAGQRDQLSTAIATHIHCAPVVLQCINASPCGHVSGEIDQASLLPFCFLISLLLNKESLSLEEQLCSPVN